MYLEWFKIDKYGHEAGPLLSELVDDSIYNEYEVEVVIAKLYNR